MDRSRTLQTSTDIYRHLQTSTDIYRHLQTSTDIYLYNLHSAWRSIVQCFPPFTIAHLRWKIAALNLDLVLLLNSSTAQVSIWYHLIMQAYEQLTTFDAYIKLCQVWLAFADRAAEIHQSTCDLLNNLTDMLTANLHPLVSAPIKLIRRQ